MHQPFSTDEKQKKILVVEDNETNYKLAEHILGKSGYDADWATNGRAALEQIARNRYDLILMDIHMPGLDGFQTTAIIREQENEQRVPIIAISADTTQGYRERCLQTGMDGYLSKPYARELLLKEIDQLLGTIKNTPMPSSFPQEQKNQEYFEIMSWLSFERILATSQGDIDLLRKMTAALDKRAQQLLLDIQVSTEKQDSQLLLERCHALKGMLGNFTIEGPFKKTLLIEELVQKKRFQKIETILPSLKAEIMTLQIFLQEKLIKFT